MARGVSASQQSQLKKKKGLVKVIANWKLSRCQDSKLRIWGGGGERVWGGWDVFELVFACRKYRSWVDMLSEVFHGNKNLEIKRSAR